MKYFEDYGKIARNARGEVKKLKTKYKKNFSPVHFSSPEQQ